MIALVVAMDKNNLIGRNNTLPWSYPEDLKYFKNLTLNKTVLMGRKTFLSIIALLVEPLPKRKSLVITSDVNFSYPGVEVIHDLQAFLTNHPQEDIFIIGGKQVYEASLKYVEKMYITHINQEYEGDTYLEGINYQNFFLTKKTVCGDLSFCVYERR